MKRRKLISGSAGCLLSRRGFLLAGCGACVGAAGLLANQRRKRNAEGEDKTRIRIVYALYTPEQKHPDWPNMGFDFGPVMERISSTLREQCPGFEFFSSMARGPEQAKRVLAWDGAGHVDGYLVYQLNCWNPVVQIIATSGKPVLYADFQYGGSGGFLLYNAEFLRSQTPNVGFVASSRMEDLVEAVKCFAAAKKGGSVADFVAATARVRIARTPEMGKLTCTPDDPSILPVGDCIALMRESKILIVHDQTSGAEMPFAGIQVERVSFAELNEAWEDADREESRAVAERWQSNATAVVDVSRETLEKSAAMYLAMKSVLKKHGANAISIDCLDGLYGGHIQAYPCLGFHELNNEGLIGGCEADLAAAATMVAVTTLTQGRPGYISDPVIDTSKRQIIYAHCLASNKVFGPKGPANPFMIMTHSEDRRGASVRSILPLGYMTTTLKMQRSGKEILFHQGKAVENVSEDRACRTKLAVEPVGDIEKLFRQWDRWEWHRVTCYGDLKEPIFALADAMGYTVVEEA